LQLEACPNCGRTFYPDRLQVHLKSCRPNDPLTLPIFAKQAMKNKPPGLEVRFKNDFRV
jgi:hypothetical protein